MAKTKAKALVADGAGGMVEVRDRRFEAIGAKGYAAYGVLSLCPVES